MVRVGVEIDPSLAAGFDTVNGKLSDVADHAGAAGDAFAQAMAKLSDVGPALQEAGTAAQGAAEDLKKAGESASFLGEGFKELLGEAVALGAALLTLDALKDVASDALAVYGNIQKADISLTALTGSAEAATGIIENLKSIAIADALSFPNLVSAAQRMTALGFSASDMYKSLQTAADTAAATGKSFESVTNAIDRMVLSGTVQARMLATLGLSTDALSKSMGVAATDVTAAFKALDQTERIQVINDALAKFGGVAAQVAGGISGQWQNLKTQWEFVLEDMGAALAPLASHLMSDLAPALQVVVQGFKDLFSAIGPLIGGVLGSLGQGLSDILTVVGGTISAVSNLVSAILGLKQPVADGAYSWKSFLDDLRSIDPLHAVAVELQLMQTNMSMWVQAAQLMKQRFDEVTASLKTFIDTSTSKTGLLGIRNDLDAQNKALADAESHLALVKKAYDEGMASPGQYAAAVKAVETAQLALNPNLVTAKQAAAELATANKDLTAGLSLLDSMVRSATPAVLDLATAQNNLKVAQAGSEAANTALLHAVNDLAAANALGTKGYSAQQAAVESLKTAEDNAKQAKGDLAKAEKDLSAAQKDATQLSKDQATTDSDYATMLNTLGKQALESYAQGIANVSAARSKYVEAVTNEMTIQAQLDALAAAGKQGTEEYTTAQGALTAAHQQVATALKDLSAAQQVAKQSITDLKAGTTELLADQAALSNLYKDHLVGDSRDLATAVQALTDARQKEKQAAADLLTAEQNLAAVKQSSNATDQDLKKATDDARAARQSLTDATKTASAAEGEIAQQFGISKTAADVLAGSAVSLTEVFKDLGLKSTQQDQSKLAALQAELDLLQQANAPLSQQLQVEQQIARAHLTINETIGASASSTLQWAIALQEAKDKQDAIKASAMALVNVYQDIRTAVMGAFQNVTGNLVKDLFGGIDNSALTQQIADLKSQLADTTAAWNQTQQDIAAQMAQATANNKAQLQTQLQDLQTQLDQKTQAYNDYVANYNTQLDALKQASADQTAQEVQNLKDALAQKQDAYNQFYQNTVQKISDLQQAEKDSLANTLSNLQSSLANETETYNNFVTDVNIKLGRIGETLADSIASRTTQEQRAIQDNQTTLQRDREDTATRIQRLQAAETASNKTSTDQQIADLRTALARKEADSKTFIQRQTDDLATFTQQAKDQAQQQTDDLKTQLAQRTEDYKEYADKNAKQQEDATTKAQGQLHQQIENLKDALWKQGQALYTATEDTKKKIVEVTDKNADELAKRETALKTSLDKQTAAYEKAKTDIEDKMKDATTKAGEQLTKQETALQKSLDKQADAYQKYVDGINGYTDKQGVYHEGQLDKIQDKYKTVWGDIATGLTTIGGTMLTNITTAFFTPLATKIADSVAGLTGIFTTMNGPTVLGQLDHTISTVGGDLTAMGQSGVDAAGKIATAMTGIAPGAAGGAGQAAGGAAGAAGQAAGSILSSISSIVGMVTGAISAITGIIGIFQNMHQESTLKAIEHETARMAIYLGDQAGNNIQFYTGKTFEWLGYIRTDMNASLGNIFTDLDFIKVWGVKDLDAISSNTYWSLQKLQEIDNKTGAAGGTEIGQLSWMQTALQNINNNLVAIVQEYPWLQQAFININNNTYAAAVKLEGILELFQTGSAKISGGVAGGPGGTIDPKALGDLASYIGANFLALEGWLFSAFGKSMALPALPAMPTIPNFGVPVSNSGGNTPAVTQLSNSIGGDHITINMTNTFPLGKPDDATIQRIGDALVSRLRIRGGPKMAL